MYPVAYIEKALPDKHPSRDIILSKCRQLLINGDEGLEVEWPIILNMCIFHHPRFIAQQLFDLAMNTCVTEEGDYALFSQSEIEYIVQGIL